MAPDGSILEYIGSLAKSEGPSLMFRRWNCPQGARPGAVLTLSEDTPARGAGTDLLLSYHDVWPGPTAVRVFLERDDSSPRGTKGITRRLVREVTQLSPTTET